MIGNIFSQTASSLFLFIRNNPAVLVVVGLGAVWLAIFRHVKAINSIPVAPQPLKQQLVPLSEPYKAPLLPTPAATQDTVAPLLPQKTAAPLQPEPSEEILIPEPVVPHAGGEALETSTEIADNADNTPVATEDTGAPSLPQEASAPFQPESSQDADNTPGVTQDTVAPSLPQEASAPLQPESSQEAAISTAGQREKVPQNINLEASVTAGWHLVEEPFVYHDNTSGT